MALRLKGLHTYNIGSGKGIIMHELLKIIERIAGKKLPIKEKGQRLGDPDRLVADISKIQKELGWEPETSLEQGLKETYNYYLLSHIQ